MSALTEKQLKDTARLVGGILSSLGEKDYPYDPGKLIAALKAVSGGQFEMMEDAESLLNLTLGEARKSFERRYLTVVLEACDGNLEKAAKKAGISRKSLRQAMNEHGIRE